MGPIPRIYEHFSLCMIKAYEVVSKVFGKHPVGLFFPPQIWVYVSYSIWFVFFIVDRLLTVVLWVQHTANTSPPPKLNFSVCIRVSLGPSSIVTSCSLINPVKRAFFAYSSGVWCVKSILNWGLQNCRGSRLIIFITEHEAITMKVF